MHGQDSGTRVTLLGRLRDSPASADAWDAFVAAYGPKIYGWCRKRRLQEADAEDVTQMVLLRLAKTLPDFVYDPSRSFRAWLKTLTQHAWADFVSRQQRGGQASGDSAVALLLQSVEARDDLVQYLNEEFDRELLAEAIARVRLRVAEATWDAFRLTALEGMSGAEAAEHVPLSVAQVFVAKSRVQKMLQEEVRRLEQSEGA
jgi:RNA polymerase sigma factor (sigma-70 family)